MPFPPPPPAIVRPLQVAQTQELAVLKVVIEDGLMMGEFISPADVPLIIFVQAPTEAVQDGQLSDEHKEQLLARMYGQGWRMGNSDGSMYVVLSYSSSLLDAEEAKAEGWRSTPGAWLYTIGANGVVEKLGDGYVPK